MTKSLRIGLSVFSITYVALSLLITWLLPGGWLLASVWASYLFVYAVAALCAVLVGVTFGRLTIVGVAGCALAIQVAVIAVVVGSDALLAWRGANTVVPLSRLGSAVTQVSLWWLGGIIASIIWPVVWVLVSQRICPRSVPLGS